MSRRTDSRLALILPVIISIVLIAVIVRMGLPDINYAEEKNDKGTTTVAESIRQDKGIQYTYIEKEPLSEMAPDVKIDNDSLETEELESLIQDISNTIEHEKSIDP